MTDIQALLGSEAEDLLSYRCTGIPSEQLHLPGDDYVSRVVSDMDRSPVVMRNLQMLLNHGRLGGTGYLSILPVDQGIEHSGAASFAPPRLPPRNPDQPGCCSPHHRIQLPAPPGRQ